MKLLAWDWFLEVSKATMLIERFICEGQKEIRGVCMPEKKSKQEVKDDDVVYIGRKPVMSYVLAAVTQFNTGDSNKVVLKARGRAISKAVDVSEIVRNKFIQELKLDDIKTGTEEVKREDGSVSNVSSIEIYMSK